MKLIAFYLPQFHRIPENDKWWGEGFTEWTNVKKARPVFTNQIQPKIPLNENYYNILDRNTVEWQTNLMNKYGIYGFCYYHYWFSSKKMLLEKPAENLLKWKDINQRFCFAWANCTWARTWSRVKVSKTYWAGNDVKKSSFDDGILLNQEYGSYNDWEYHYKYLRKFFLDDRYIKEKNKPVFLIYQLGEIDVQIEMFKLWNDLAKKDGFDGMHIVSMNEYPINNKYVEAVVKYGNYDKYDRNYLVCVNNKLIRFINNLFNINIKRKKKILDYEKVWKGLVSEQYDKGCITYPGAVVNYDDTPRKDDDLIYLQNSSPYIFEKYLKKQVEKAKNDLGVEYLFIDAWNEWGEGNYLEPDTINQYKYLEAVKNVVDSVGKNEYIY